MLVWLLVIAGAVALDQLSKALVMYGLKLDEVGETIPLIKDVFHFTHVRNTGAAFGMLGEEDQRWIFILISLVGIGALFVYLWKFRPSSKLACTALSLIIGGGIGNMIDRCFRVGTVGGEERHYVFDFIDFCAFPDLWKWTFNVADAFVCVGAGILLVWSVYALIKETKAEKAKKALADGEPENTEAATDITETEKKDSEPSAEVSESEINDEKNDKKNVSESNNDEG